MSTKVIKKTKVIQTRLDANLVDQASEILDYIGLSTTDAVRILLKNIVNTGGLPFELKKPENPSTQKPKNPPILELSPEKITKIEKQVDNYYAGNLKTTRIANKDELIQFLNQLDN